MSVGFTKTKADIDARAGSVALDIRGVFDRIQTLKTTLDTLTDPQLVALGYVQAEVDTLRSAMGDLDQLRTIYQGTANLASAKDFRTFAKLLTGVV